MGGYTCEGGEGAGVLVQCDYCSCHTCMLATEVFTALFTSTFDLKSSTDPHTSAA